MRRPRQANRLFQKRESWEGKLRLRLWLLLCSIRSKGEYWLRPKVLASNRGEWKKPREELKSALPGSFRANVSIVRPQFLLELLCGCYRGLARMRTSLLFCIPRKLNSLPVDHTEAPLSPGDGL